MSCQCENMIIWAPMHSDTITVMFGCVGVPDWSRTKKKKFEKKNIYTKIKEKKRQNRKEYYTKPICSV